MNSAALKGFVTRNKTMLLIAGAAAVALLALRARKNAAAGSGTGTTNASTSGAGSPGTYSAYGQTVPYDSTATDVYNQLQPVIEQLQQEARNIPVSTPPEPTTQGYFRRTGTQAVYEARSDGTLKWVDAADYAAAGKPAFTDTVASDPLWNRPVVGTDAPAQFR